MYNKKKQHIYLFSRGHSYGPKVLQFFIVCFDSAKYLQPVFLYTTHMTGDIYISRPPRPAHVPSEQDYVTLPVHINHEV